MLYMHKTRINSLSYHLTSPKTLQTLLLGVAVSDLDFGLVIDPTLFGCILGLAWVMIAK